MLSGIALEDDIYEYLIGSSMNERLCSKLSMDVLKLNDSSDSKHVNELAKRASIGDGPAMFEIGLHYYHGDKYFKQDEDTGIKWIKNAANAKYKEAQFMLADLYKKGAAIEQDYHRAAIWYRKIAKGKDAQAQCNVGIMYKEGLGVRKDPLEASKWFIWAADQGNSEAQYNIGMLRYDGKGLQQVEKEAVKWLYKSVRQRNIQACFQLGSFYFYGRAGLEKDEENAMVLLDFASKNKLMDALMFLGDINWHGNTTQNEISKSIEYYTMAADAGNAEALYKMALTYLNGNDISHDYIKAYKLLKQAKEKGYERASFLFEIPIQYDLYIKDYSKVIDMFTEVTENGLDDLSHHIGCLYWYGVEEHHGDIAFQQNSTKAKEWFLMGSEKSDSRADYRLGIMYECGKGIEKSLATSAYHYKKSIANDNSDAMYRLACMYLNGYNDVQDSLQAFHLYTKASGMGHQKATEALEVFQKEDKGKDHWSYSPKDPEITINRENQIKMLEKIAEEGFIRLQYQLGLMYEYNSEYSKALKWLSLAVDFGITDAYYRIGVFYEEGRGIEQNYTMAADMYQKAVEKEHEDACYRLGQLYQYGNGVQLDYLKAYDLYKKADEMGHYLATVVLNITLKTKVQLNGDVEKNSFNVSSKEYQHSLTMCKYVAEHGNTEVQFKVGFAHEYSFPEPNYVEACKWYSMAANNSHREATYHLGLLYEQGLGVSQNYHEAIQLYNQASQLGSDDALFRLAIVYHHGKGVDVDPKKAIKYYILSAEHGNPEYQFELGRIYEEGDLVHTDPLEVLKWYTIAYAQGYDKIRPKLRAMYEDKKPYEKFFYEKLLQNLSTATCNHFGLNEHYRYNDFGKINNRLGTLYFFGLGTSKNLKKAFEYFSREYSDTKDKLISYFNFLHYDVFSVRQKNDILNEFERNEEFMNQLEPEKLYTLGMIYYDGMVKTKSVSYENRLKGYTPIDEQDPNDASQYAVVEKNHLKAFKYMKKAAEKQYYKAMMEPVLFHYLRDANKDNMQDKQSFVTTLNGNINALDSTTTLQWVQDFSKAVEWYDYLEEILDEDEEMPEDTRKKINEIVQLGWGYLYEYGFGMQQDYEKAMKYYKLLADDKHPMGCFRLAFMYYYGKGVSVDYKKSFELFGEVENDLFWDDKIVFMYDQEDLHTSDFHKKIMYRTRNRFVLRGESYYYLGLMYKHGQSVPKDDFKAQLYFNGAHGLDCDRAENEFKD